MDKRYLYNCGFEQILEAVQQQLYSHLLLISQTTQDKQEMLKNAWEVRIVYPYPQPGRIWHKYL